MFRFQLIAPCYIIILTKTDKKIQFSLYKKNICDIIIGAVL